MNKVAFKKKLADFWTATKTYRKTPQYHNFGPRVSSQESSPISTAPFPLVRTPSPTPGPAPDAPRKGEKGKGRVKPILLPFEGEILTVGPTIKLLHPWARFIISQEATSLSITSPPMLSPHFQTDKTIIKVFVGIIKDSKRNRIFKKSRKYKIVIDKPVYLKVNDKKGKSTAKKIPQYDFIDCFETNIAEEDICWSTDFRKKAQRNQTTADAKKKHKLRKAEAWRIYENLAWSCWVNRIIWKWILLNFAWEMLGIEFSTAHIKEEVLKAADFAELSSSAALDRCMYDWWGFLGSRFFFLFFLSLLSYSDREGAASFFRWGTCGRTRRTKPRESWASSFLF